MKKILLTSMILLSLGFVGCDIRSADEKQTSNTEKLMQQANNELGLPNISNFYEKKLMKQIMEACDDSKLITYAYTKNEATGKLVYIGQAMGYGLPYGTQYTNPEKKDYQVTLPQADPNGLYKAQNVSATWVMLIDEKTKKAQPVYIESDITISQFKLPERLCDKTSLPEGY